MGHILSADYPKAIPGYINKLVPGIEKSGDKNRMVLHITIPGRCLPKNRHYRVGPRGLRLSKAFRTYQQFVVGDKNRPGWLIQWAQHRFEGPVKVRPRFIFATRRSWSDTDNLLKTLGDFLQKAGIVTNDRNITWLVDPDPRILERGGEERVELEIWEEG